ncbi:MAG: hypothetical protein PHG00_01655 [Methylococcales bacterium]|nr:hypothetical protein [Methylococcales bacterium]
MTEIPYDYVGRVPLNDFGVYKGLYWHERLAINDYMLRNDKEPLNQIIENANMSKGMERFIVDMIAGRIKRPASTKATTLFFDIEISKEIKKIRDENPKMTQKAAADIIAAQICRPTDSVCRMDNRGKRYRQENQEHFLKYMIENYHPKQEK